MNLHKPSKAVFLIAVALAVLALVGFFLTVPIITQYHFWLALAGFPPLGARLHPVGGL